METKNVIGSTVLSNSSSSNDVIDGKIDVYLALSQVLNGILLATTTWILLCMVGYGIKKNKFNRSKGGILYITCIVAVVATFVKILMDMLLFQVPKMTGKWETCDALMKVGNFVGGCSVYATYVFLWLRQRAIYSDRIMENMFGRKIKAFSWFVLVLINVSFIGLGLGYVIPESYALGVKGCARDDMNVSIEWNHFKSFVFLGALILVQVFLIYLFTYPMIRNTYYQRRQRGDGERERNSAMVALIKRSLIGALFVIVSDTTVAISTTFYPWSYPFVIPHVFYNCSFVINLFSIIATFGESCKIMRVFCRWPTSNTSSIEEDRETEYVVEDIVTPL